MSLFHKECGVCHGKLMAGATATCLACDRQFCEQCVYRHMCSQASTPVLLCRLAELEALEAAVGKIEKGLRSGGAVDKFQVDYYAPDHFEAQMIEYACGMDVPAVNGGDASSVIAALIALAAQLPD